MNQVKPQWSKRVGITRYFYSDLMLDNSADAIIKIAFENHNFDQDQMKVVEYYAHHKKTIIDLINANLAKTWTWARIPQVEKAILITAVCEHHVNKFDRKIIIDQALVSTKHYANPEASGYINAILDKILK